MIRAASTILRGAVGRRNSSNMNANVVFTATNLKRWSCQDKELPPVEKVKHIHIYDFDNTLFASPLPNRQIWNGPTIGALQTQEFLHNGGWWHNPRILAATGGGLEVEEPRAWQGCWNEKIVDLVELSMKDEDTLTVLLTGRSEHGFKDLVGRMVAAKRLDFDIMALKPKVSPTGELFKSTIEFKESILRDIVYTYCDASELRIYEDRPRHVKAFQQFFANLNQGLVSDLGAPREPINAEVVFVSEQELDMDPVSEVAEVQSMVNAHNQAILDRTAPAGSRPFKVKRSVLYTGYLISPPDISRLKSLISLPASIAESDLRYLANNIVITPRPAPRSILDKVGGIGAKVMWKVTGYAVHEQRIWAARVQPMPAGTRVHTDSHTAFVVLATRRNSKPVEAGQIRNWQPVSQDQAFEFETTVGEKVILRVEEEYRNEDDFDSSRNSRKHPRDEDFPPLGPRNGPQRPQQRNTSRGGGGGGYSPARGGMQTRGGQRGGGGGRGRGRGNRGGPRGGGRGAYRSLDDSAGQSYGGGGMQY